MHFVRGSHTCTAARGRLVAVGNQLADVCLPSGHGARGLCSCTCGLLSSWVSFCSKFLDALFWLVSWRPSSSISLGLGGGLGGKLLACVHVPLRPLPPVSGLHGSLRVFSFTPTVPSCLPSCFFPPHPSHSFFFHFPFFAQLPLKSYMLTVNIVVRQEQKTRTAPLISSST